MSPVYRPIPITDPARPGAAMQIAGGAVWAAQAEEVGRGIVLMDAVPAEVLAAWARPAPQIAGLDLSRPAIMGILNVTPDSFSDGGQFNAPDAAVARAFEMVEQGADILDIGGESTRPGAAYVDVADEIARTAPVIAAIRAQSDVPISIDTRKAAVAEAALAAGASLVNDVSALTHDPDLAAVVARAGVPVCLMHAQGDPKTMQDNPQYTDVVSNVYGYLEERVNAAIKAGISADQIMVDPGIGFGKTLDHNLELLRRISAFHGLGCPILLGASRKRFIGTLTGTDEAQDRVHGSVAIAVHSAAQGVQVLRVHDIPPTQQALQLASYL